MLHKTITFEDLDGNKITEDFYFNLSTAEITEMQLSTEGGFAEYLQQIIQSNKASDIIQAFKMILQKSYGVRSADGRRFIKSPELWQEFEQTGAFDVLFMELVTDADAAANFVNAVIPEGLQERAASLQASQPKQEETALEATDEAIPAWLREGRDPTQAELASMSKAEMALAMRAKLNSRP